MPLGLNVFQRILDGKELNFLRDVIGNGILLMVLIICQF